MGNPHPTISKPNKIGRKHTKKPGSRRWQIAQSEKSKRVERQKKLAKINRHIAQVEKYWRGEIDNHP